ncbi:hypothetical protein [Anaeromyxobacter oryzae]|uniref:Integral membrane protein n=1 Tax=Anaeromyxobacter oryzae TaxID=2918170 RepID=A0ABM7X0V7_9BACT|nr:hypothetical protein [Anaeromyxobacter oryzae]BDG05450.1 hypothetical protein AMOR_44460 [Anaeromyxobacter oryzae]
MLRVVPPALHGVLDYVVAAALVIAPTLLGASGGAAAICFVLGVGQAAMSLVTAYPLGVVPVVPFWAHGVVEVGSAALLLFLGLLTGPASGLFVVVALAIFGLAALTDYRATDRDPALRRPAHARVSARRRS